MTDQLQQSLQSLLQEALDHQIITHQELVFASCQVARSVLHLVPAGNETARLAIEAAEKWCIEPSEENRKAADDAANDADAYAAYIAAYAANASYSEADAAFAVSCCVDDAAAQAAWEAANGGGAIAKATAAIAIVFGDSSFTASAIDNAAYTHHQNLPIEQQKMKQLLLSHLPNLKKWMVWL